MNRKFIGLSVSFCVRDIYEGKVNLDEVQMIIAGTKAETPEQWDRVVAQYKTYYWQRNPQECERIFRTLLNTGRIVQPRLLGLQPPNVSQGSWALQVRL